jgi:hypothetical protein
MRKVSSKASRATVAERLFDTAQPTIAREKASVTNAV